MSIIASAVPGVGDVLVGPDGHDADGHPLRHVGALALRALLREGRHAELDRAFETLQQFFEADPRCEHWPDDAAEAFAVADPALEAPLDSWVAASPSSFAPYLARGAYNVEVGYVRRGSKRADDTHDDDFAAMRAAHDKAAPDLETALRLRPRLAAARRLQIRLLMARGRTEELMQELSAGLEDCPTCFQIRATAILALRPRWGGSYDLMREVAQAAPVAKNPRLRLLAGYVDADRCDLLRDAKDLPAALQAIDHALELGEHWYFLEKRSRVLSAMGDQDGARAAVTRAIELQPGKASLLTRRAVYERRVKDYEVAGRDLLEGLRLDPVDVDGRWIFDKVVQDVVYAGWGAYEAGRREEALRLLDLASDLDPTNQDVIRRRAWIISPGAAPAADGIAALRAAAAAAPDDLRAHQELDYALAKQRRYAEVVEMWDEYLLRNPKDGRAHLERGGALWNLGRRDEARDAARRACDLGVSEGCLRAR